MRLPRFAIEHHQFTVVIILLLVISGVVSIFTMPRSEDPQVSAPGSSVVVVYPGASPINLEQLVVDRIEEVVNELEDLRDIESHIEDGLAIVAVEFETGSDPDDKYSDVLQKVASIRNDLPDGIYSLDIHKWSVSDVNILQLALVSDNARYRDLEFELENLKRQLEVVSGVVEVETWAFPEQELRVAIDLEKLAELRIPIWQVIGAIQAESADIPGGTIDMGSKRFSIQTSGDYGAIDDVRNTIVHARNGRIVHLDDVADVRFDYEDTQYRARFNGRRAVFLTLAQKEGTNIFGVMRNLRPRIDAFESQLPSGMELHYVFDQSQSVKTNINGFFANFFQGVILVGVVVLLALGSRAAGIVMLAIPFSILIALGFVDTSGFGIQQMSIVGLVIALGLLVDNAIVVVENVSRFMQKGLKNSEAAVQGTDQIGWAIVSATATTVLAFGPLAMLRSMTGDFLRSMPLTVIFALSASLLISLTLTPYLSSRILRTTPVSEPGLFRRWLNRFIETRYRSALSYALDRPKRVIVIALVIFAASLALFPVVGFSLFPKSGKKQFVVNIDTPKGTSLDRTDEVARYVETFLDDRDEIKHYATNVGRGNPRIYYNVMPKNARSTHAQIFVMLEDIDTRKLADLITELRSGFETYPGARIEVKEFEQGPPVEAPIAIKAVSDDLDDLKEMARRIEHIIDSTPGTVNVGNPLRTSKTDLHVKINRGKAAMLGVPLVDIDRVVRAGIAGIPVSKYYDATGKEYDIVVRLPIGRKPVIEDFDAIRVTSVTGAQIPLKQLAAIELKASPTEINHYNLERSATVTADVLGGYSVDRVSKRIVARLRECDIPKGCRFSIGGELESREESFSGLMRAIITALIAIFGVLVLQFRSYRQPLIVFSAIPLAIIGSIVAIFLTGHSFSFTAFVGLTSLVGIVINNSIILVDYTNKLRIGGTDLVQALREAGQTRFTPIVLTTATTICGLLPLTVAGGSLWAPMGWTIIGGLLVSTFLTLIVVPVLYKLTEGKRG
ncbi:MAG: efflux RND transporter permease subunit [bacterium]|nr:MAG: efflux RND transporter permease subunit [bacterium]